MIKKRPYHGKIVIKTKIYFSAKSWQTFLCLHFLVLSRWNNNGIALGTSTNQSFRGFAYNMNAVISTSESTEFITGHVIYNLAYTYKFQLKTTIICFSAVCPIWKGIDFSHFSLYLFFAHFRPSITKRTLWTFHYWNPGRCLFVWRVWCSLQFSHLPT